MCNYLVYFFCYYLILFYCKFTVFNVVIQIVRRIKSRCPLAAAVWATDCFLMRLARDRSSASLASCSCLLLMPLLPPAPASSHANVNMQTTTLEQHYLRVEC